MNKLIMSGRLTKDPEISFGGGNNTQVARFSLAVDKRFKREGESGADFFNCVAFGKTAEFIEKYFHKGMKALIEGEIHNNDYTNREGQKVHSEQIVISSIEFCEKKGAEAAAPSNAPDDFNQVTDDDLEELPFK